MGTGGKCGNRSGTGDPDWIYWKKKRTLEFEAMGGETHGTAGSWERNPVPVSMWIWRCHSQGWQFYKGIIPAVRDRVEGRVRELKRDNLRDMYSLFSSGNQWRRTFFFLFSLLESTHNSYNYCWGTLWSFHTCKQCVLLISEWLSIYTSVNILVLCWEI